MRVVIIDNQVVALSETQTLIEVINPGYPVVKSKYPFNLLNLRDFLPKIPLPDQYWLSNLERQIKTIPMKTLTIVEFNAFAKKHKLLFENLSDVEVRSELLKKCSTVEIKKVIYAQVLSEQIAFNDQLQETQALPGYLDREPKKD